MTYGLKVFAANDILLIDSTLSNVGLQIVDSGSTSTFTDLDYQDLIFIRPTAVISDLCLVRTYTSGGSASLRRASTGALVAANFIRCRRSTNLVAGGTSALVGDYGLQVLNASGDVAFDSRAFHNNNIGLSVVGFVGQRTTTSANRLITSNLNHYVLMNWSYRASSSYWGGIERNTGGLYYNGNTPVNLSDIAYAESFNT